MSRGIVKGSDAIKWIWYVEIPVKYFAVPVYFVDGRCVFVSIGISIPPMQSIYI